MNNPNIKIYLAISFALIVLFILILIVPFSKKTINNNPQPTISVPFPTSIETNSTGSTDDSTNIPVDFTGVAEEELPPEVLDTSLQKKDLRQKTPLDLSTFIIDFDYGEDKFVVSLYDPKDQAQREFENWRTINYPGLGAEQFVLK